MSTTTEKKPEDNKKTQLTHLEEDDEFEDFPAEDWTDAEAGVNLPGGKTALWEDNWDDDDVEDDFSNQLKAELEKDKQQTGQAQPMQQ
ncbi:26S proteasome complex subunit SEM1 [Saitoella coloradoensis]